MVLESETKSRKRVQNPTSLLQATGGGAFDKKLQIKKLSSY